jgi:hypothetical protein
MLGRTSRQVLRREKAIKILTYHLLCSVSEYVFRAGQPTYDDPPLV